MNDLLDELRARAAHRQDMIVLRRGLLSAFVISLGMWALIWYGAAHLL